MNTRRQKLSKVKLRGLTRTLTLTLRTLGHSVTGSTQISGKETKGKETRTQNEGSGSADANAKKKKREMNARSLEDGACDDEL